MMLGVQTPSGGGDDQDFRRFLFFARPSGRASERMNDTV